MRGSLKDEIIILHYQLESSYRHLVAQFLDIGERLKHHQRSRAQMTGPIYQERSAPHDPKVGSSNQTTYSGVPLTKVIPSIKSPHGRTAQTMWILWSHLQKARPPHKKRTLPLLWRIWPLRSLLPFFQRNNFRPPTSPHSLIKMGGINNKKATSSYALVHIKITAKDQEFSNWTLLDTGAIVKFMYTLFHLRCYPRKSRLSENCRWIITGNNRATNPTQGRHR